MSGSFFPLEPGEKAILVFLVVFSAIAFLPVWGGMEIAGMAMFGWLMAGLMLVSPALALLVMRRRTRKGP